MLDAATQACALRAAVHLGCVSPRPVRLRAQRRPLELTLLPLHGDGGKAPKGSVDFVVLDSWAPGTQQFAVVAGASGHNVVPMPVVGNALYVFHAWTLSMRPNALQLTVMSDESGAYLVDGFGRGALCSYAKCFC